MSRMTLGMLALILGACTEGSTSGGVPGTDKLQASCESLVSAETGTRSSDVNAMSTQTEPTGTLITVAVAGSQTPWLCSVDVTGVVTGVAPA